jgi:nickel/cobalt exporter
MYDTAGILITAAASTAAVHTLLPDHWLPFVLLGRAQKWSLLKAAWFAGLSALVHVAVSLTLGGLALGVGIGAARALGEKLGLLTGVLLCAFGAAYSIWAIRSGGHSHHHLFRHAHGGTWPLHQPHAPTDEAAPLRGPGGGSKTPREPHAAHAVTPGGHANHEADLPCGQAAPLPTEKTSAYSLMLIVGIHPCVLALPILFASAPLGSFGITIIAVTYALCTIIAMIVVTLLGLTATRQIRMGFLENRGDLLTGVIVFAVGVFMLAHG